MVEGEDRLPEYGNQQILTALPESRCRRLFPRAESAGNTVIPSLIPIKPSFFRDIARGVAVFPVLRLQPIPAGGAKSLQDKELARFTAFGTKKQPHLKKK
jgi:hypothetical protein